VATKHEGRSSAQVAADLVRTVGLVGLVRPATTSTHPRSVRHDVTRPESGTVVRLRTVTGAASGLNAGNIPGGLDAPDRTLPVIPEFRPLLPGRSLRRGSTVAVSGATSVVLGLLAAASKTGSWCAVVGMPALGLRAAAEAGIALERLALVPYPGPDWSAVVAAMLDGVDMVVIAPGGPVAVSVTSRLAARARQRGSVLIAYGRWPGADVVLDSTQSRWEGLSQGAGRLHRRQLTVVLRGRGAAARKNAATLWWPAFLPVHTDWSVADWRRRDRANRAGLSLVPSLDVDPGLGTADQSPAARAADEPLAACGAVS
jgi:hypothetical protein